MRIIIGTMTFFRRLWDITTSELASELLFSLNLAWVAVWIQRVHNAYLFPAYVSRFLDHLYSKTLIPQGETVLFQIVCSLMLAAMLFLFLRLVSCQLRKHASVGILAAMVAVSASPIAALLLPTIYSLPSEVLVGEYFEWFYPAQAYRFWLLSELIVCLICVGFYCSRGKLVYPLLAILFLLLHFGLWSWATGMHRYWVSGYGNFLGLNFWIQIIFYWGSPVLGFWAALTSSFYSTTLTIEVPHSAQASA